MPSQQENQIKQQREAWKDNMTAATSYSGQSRTEFVQQRKP